MSTLQTYLEQKEKTKEGLCKRCGGCCGAFDDPCLHLKKKRANIYHCEIYDKRFGDRETITGDEFTCVMVKEIINTHWKNEHLCAYKDTLKHLKIRKKK